MCTCPCDGNVHLLKGTNWPIVQYSCFTLSAYLTTSMGHYDSVDCCVELWPPSRLSMCCAIVIKHQLWASTKYVHSCSLLVSGLGVQKYSYETANSNQLL